MPKKSLDGLTESMFYLLMAFCRQPMCGIDAAAFIEQKTGGRLRLGPATLYTILGKFEKVKYIAGSIFFLCNSNFIKSIL